MVASVNRQLVTEIGAHHRRSLRHVNSNNTVALRASV